MEKKKYTIKDIAELANVSRGTVDRVLNKRGRVSEKASKKVEDILEQIDYKPNLIARSLKNHRTYRIALLIPDYENDLYWKQMNHGIEEASKEMGQFGMSIEYFDGGDSEEEYYSSFKSVLESEPDALILVPFYTDKCLGFYKELEERKIPFVLLNSPIDKVGYSSFIGQNYWHSGRTAAYLMHLLTSTLEDDKKLLILHFGVQTENSSHVKEKEKGFLDYLKEVRPHAEIEIINFEKKINFNLLSDKLNATKGIYITNSKTHLISGVLMNHPMVKVIGYDLIPENIELLSKGTVDILLNQNPKLQGYHGVTLLSEYLLYKREIPKNKLLPIDIITKENILGYV